MVKLNRQRLYRQQLMTIRLCEHPSNPTVFVHSEETTFFGIIEKADIYNPLIVSCQAD
jgi:hypothetical protein